MMRITSFRRNFIAGLGAALAITTAAVASSGPAQASNAPAPKPTVVLVHGGFADASASWNDVVQQLQRRGYPVVAPANPLRGLPQDSAYIASVLHSITGRVILVGHSYGGAVITNAAASAPNVKALVYVAALVPDTGEALGELINKFPGSEIQAAGWHTIPSWGLIATDDKAIPPALQRFEYRRAGAHTVSVAASHVAMISHPDLVTQLIVDAERDTR